MEPWGLALAHRGFVVTLSRFFLGRGLDRDDLIQEGLIAAARAARTYDPAAGEFARYARWFIRDAMYRAVIDGALVRVGKKCRARLGDAAPRAWGVELPGEVESPAPGAPDPGDRAARLQALLGRLSATERAALRLRYGLDGTAPLTLMESAAVMQCGFRGVSKAEKRALSKLRRMAT